MTEGRCPAIHIEKVNFQLHIFEKKSRALNMASVVLAGKSGRGMQIYAQKMKGRSSVHRCCATITQEAEGSWKWNGLAQTRSCHWLEIFIVFVLIDEFL